MPFKPADITGQKFGFLTAIEPTAIRYKHNRAIIWICYCECGGAKFVPTFILRRSHRHSCGKCDLGGREYEDLSGQQFGRLKVLSQDTQPWEKPKGRKIWLCRCECGTETRVRTDELKRKHVISCGCYARERAVSMAAITPRLKGRFQKTYEA